MSCLLCGGRRKAKRVTVPAGADLSLGHSAARSNNHQQPSYASAAQHAVSPPQAVRCRTYQYHELQAATSNFSSSNVIGEGGFGRVFKGRLSNGAVVAVKRLDRHGMQGDLEFNVEVSIMAGLSHANVVPLLGSCCEADQRVAVFVYMPHGNLRDLLDGKVAAARHFNWPARLNVLLGVAKGLAYLHEGVHPAVIHRDLKSSNILIDAKGQGRICDFGLARHKMLLYNSHNPPAPNSDGIMMGTYGYMAPEYAASGQTSDKSDVYAFGVVVLEIMSGMQAVDARRPEGCEALPQLLQPALQAVQLMQGNLDPALNRHAPLPAAQLAALCEVAASCLEPQPSDRPPAARLVTYLQSLLRSTDKALASAQHHTRTLSAPPSSPVHARHPSTSSVSDTPRDFHQHSAADFPSSSQQPQSQQQQQPQQQLQQQQQQRQGRHRPAQSMPHLGAAAPDSAGGWLHQGASLRSSAGYGNELGIPGPSRHLTPLAQGLQAANSCSLPAASVRAPAVLQPLAQERPADLPPLLYVHTPQQPLAMSQHTAAATSSDNFLVGSFEQAAEPQHMEAASGYAGFMVNGFEAGGRLGEEGQRPRYGQAGRDLRDSAWGPPLRPQQPSAPPFPRQSVLRPVSGHRPTQSHMPPQSKLVQSSGHARSVSTPPDESLFQLVQSRAPHQQSQQHPPAATPSSSHQLATGVRPMPESSMLEGSMPNGSVHAQQQQQPVVRQRSGNPFAKGDEASSSRGGMMSSASQAAQVLSGNPFGEVGVASQGVGGVGVSQPTENALTYQASANEPWGGGGSPVASLAVGKDPEMSPLQNGLIRAWPSPCKVQPPEVMARSWHHFLSSANQQPSSQGSKTQPATSHQSLQGQPARVGVCLVCLDASRDWQMVPCGHAAACKACAEQLQEQHLPCPVCRAPVTGLKFHQFQHTYVGSPARLVNAAS